MININKSIRDLVDYAISKELIYERDRVYGINRLLEVLDLYDYEEPEDPRFLDRDLEDILDEFRIWGLNNKRILNPLQKQKV